LKGNVMGEVESVSAGDRKGAESLVHRGGRLSDTRLVEALRFGNKM